MIQNFQSKPHFPNLGLPASAVLQLQFSMVPEALTLGQWVAFLKGFCKNVFEFNFVRPRNHLAGWDFQWTSPNLASAGRSPAHCRHAQLISINLCLLSLSKLLKLWGDTKITKFTKICQNEKSAESQEWLDLPISTLIYQHAQLISIRPCLLSRSLISLKPKLNRQLWTYLYRSWGIKQYFHHKNINFNCEVMVVISHSALTL